MKKLLIIALMLTMLCGCSGKKTAGVAVLLKNEDEPAVVQFVDRQDQRIAEMTIDYPHYVYQQGEMLYYSSDGISYGCIDLKQRKAGKGLSGVAGELLHVQRDGDYISYQNNTVNFYQNHQPVLSVPIYLYLFIANDTYTCLVDSSNVLSVYRNNQEIARSYLNSPSYLGLSTIDGNLYVVNEQGIMPISDEGALTTYFFGRTLDIANLKNEIVYVREGEDVVAYSIHPEEGRVSLKKELDERYYHESIFTTIFADYYTSGYYVAHYVTLWSGYDD